MHKKFTRASYSLFLEADAEAARKANAKKRYDFRK
jgi:hypothetical protein